VFGGRQLVEEQHVVRQHDGGAAVDVEDGGDVLQEVQLLVGGGDDEVLPLDLPVFAGLPTVRADHRQRRLAPERWIGCSSSARFT